MPATARSRKLPNPSETQWGAITPLLAEADLWLRPAQRKISELAQLPENWDSYGSRSIQPAAIKQAADLIAYLSKFNLPSPHIFPVSGGGIQLEFEQGGRELEIEILPDGSLEFLKVDEKGEMQEGKVLSGSEPEIRRLVYWLQGRRVEASYPFYL